jgi:hypothetical protein
MPQPALHFGIQTAYSSPATEGLLLATGLVIAEWKRLYKPTVSVLSLSLVQLALQWR